MALAPPPDDALDASVAASRSRFGLGLLVVTIGAAAFAVAFRASLAAAYQMLYGADNIVDIEPCATPWLGCFCCSL